MAQLDFTCNHVQALILAPTRELANQIRDIATELGTFLNAKVTSCVGGNSIKSGLFFFTFDRGVVIRFQSYVVFFFHFALLYFRH